GANIAAGRNAAVAATTASLVAVADAGVVLAPDWLERLLEPFRDPSVDVVSGFFRAAPRSAFEQALGATTLPAEADVRPERFLPSSRSGAFRRAAGLASGQRLPTPPLSAALGWHGRAASAPPPGSPALAAPHPRHGRRGEDAGLPGGRSLAPPVAPHGRSASRPRRLRLARAP